MEVDADVMVVKAADTDDEQWNESASGAGSSRKGGRNLSESDSTVTLLSTLAAARSPAV